MRPLVEGTALATLMLTLKRRCHWWHFIIILFHNALKVVLTQHKRLSWTTCRENSERSIGLCSVCFWCSDHSSSQPCRKTGDRVQLILTQYITPQENILAILFFPIKIETTPVRALLDSSGPQIQVLKLNFLFPQVRPKFPGVHNFVMYYVWHPITIQGN